jgi:DNA-binding CsgD family transcriptional regulator
MLGNGNILDVLEALGCGGLLLDKGGRVLQTNEIAQRYLGSTLDITRRGGTVSMSNDTMQVALRKALSDATKVLPLLSEHIIVPNAHGRPLLLRRIIFNSDQTDDSVIAAVIVVDMNDCPLPSEGLLTELYLLTPAEVRLAQRLSCGMDPSTIAREFGVARETIRAQLKTLFWKTGTHRQGELVALLAHLARLP